MNGIIHPCSHPNDDDPHFRITEVEIFKNIFNYIEVGMMKYICRLSQCGRLFSTPRNLHLIFLCSDFIGTIIGVYTRNCIYLKIIGWWVSKFRNLFIKKKRYSRCIMMAFVHTLWSLLITAFYSFLLSNTF